MTLLRFHLQLPVQDSFFFPWIVVPRYEAGHWVDRLAPSA